MRISLSGSAATYEEMSPKKIKMSERIVQKANLNPITYINKTSQQNQSHIVKKSITIAPKQLAKRDAPKKATTEEEETLGLVPQSSNLSSQRSLKPPHKPNTRTYYKSPRNMVMNSGIKSPSMMGKLPPMPPPASFPPKASPHMKSLPSTTEAPSMRKIQMMSPKATAHNSSNSMPSSCVQTSMDTITKK